MTRPTAACAACPVKRERDALADNLCEGKTCPPGMTAVRDLNCRKMMGDCLACWLAWAQREARKTGKQG